MDLKEFIRETLTSKIEASKEIQKKYEGDGIIINPPVNYKDRLTFLEDSEHHTHRRIEEVQFDVAVTASSDKAGGAKAGLRVFSAEVGANKSNQQSREEVSRVRFSIPLVLSPSTAEINNREAAKKTAEATKTTPRRNHESKGGMAV